jgi:hypothetical protein
LEKEAFVAGLLKILGDVSGWALVKIAELLLSFGGGLAFHGSRSSRRSMMVIEELTSKGKLSPKEERRLRDALVEVSYDLPKGMLQQLLTKALGMKKELPSPA